MAIGMVPVGAFLEIFTPNQAMKVVSTSEKEWMASEIMAPEWPVTPANSLNPDNTVLPRMLHSDNFRMTAFSFRLTAVVVCWRLLVVIKEPSCTCLR